MIETTPDANNDSRKAHSAFEDGPKMRRPKEASGGLTNTASWRLWSKRSERNNRLMAVTAFPIRETKASSCLCCHMQKVL